MFCVFPGGVAALSGSLWSLTMKAVLEHTLTAPYTFLSGLLIISELLPLPLPIQSREVRHCTIGQYFYAYILHIIRKMIFHRYLQKNNSFVQSRIFTPAYILHIIRKMIFHRYLKKIILLFNQGYLHQLFQV